MKPYYQDEWVTLYHGDCLTITDWLAADVLVTDPPYGIAFASHGTNVAAYAGEVTRSLNADREMTREDTKVRDAACALWGYDKPALIFGHWRSPKPHRTQNRLVWAKECPTSGGAGPWRPSDEEIYLTGWKTRKHRRPGEQPGRTVIEYRNPHFGQTDANGRLHPSIKPVGLLIYLIEFCQPGIIADPFAGSGSTLVAAKALGRKAIGVELEERYCEIAARRLAQDVLDFGEPA